MDYQPSAPDIKWPEFAVAPSRQRESARAVVIPMVVKRGGPCFAVTVDQRWLCGSEGELTFFSSMAAARRFLELMKVDGFSFGVAQAVAAQHCTRVQCYCLASQGLRACTRCSIGELAAARAVKEEALQQNYW